MGAGGPRFESGRPDYARPRDAGGWFPQTVIMVVLALRVLLAPCFVVVASLVARRFGVRLGGLVAGLPVIAGPILLVLALQHGAAFAGRAAIGVLLGVVGLAAFVLAYVAAASRLSWRGAVVAAYAAYGLAVVAMREVSTGPVPALGIACGSLALTLVLLPRPPRIDPLPLAPPRWDLPFRAACTAAAVVTVTAVATKLGPHLSGLLTSIPIITAVLSVFTHAHRGRDETIRLLRGFTVGFVSYAAFCFVVATTIRPFGITACFTLAVVVALSVQATSVAASRRRVLRARRVASGPRDASAPEFT